MSLHPNVRIIWIFTKISILVIIGFVILSQVLH